MKRLILFTALALGAWGQTAGKPVDLDIAGDKAWTDTGVDVEPGDSINIAASGTITYAGKETGPTGLARGWADLVKVFPLNDAKRGALIGRVGDNAGSRPFLIGDRTDRQIAVKGRLFLGPNLGSMDSATGSYKVRLTRTAGAVAVRSSPDMLKGLTKITQAQLDSFPTRVVDKDGLPGDRTNFMIVGSEVHVVSSLERAGWIKVDRTVKDTILRGILVSMSKQAYVTLPMSELTMFGRAQDYGWAQADPLKVVAARHHFRIWKAPFTAGGRTVWVGAGTHDIGFDRDQRNGKITHKIDPQTDGERDYIGSSLQETGEVLLLDYLTPKEPVKEAKTAHGETYYSDGRTLLIYLKPDESDNSKPFGDIFCTVLAKNNPDGDKWDACENYVDGGGATNAVLPDLSSQYRVLIVPGFMSSCFADSPAFNEGLPVLRDKYGLNVEYLQVPNDGSDTNAKVIADFLKEKSAGDARKWILVGYSKGTPDLQEALARYPGTPAARRGVYQRRWGLGRIQHRRCDSGHGRQVHEPVQVERELQGRYGGRLQEPQQDGPRAVPGQLPQSVCADLFDNCRVRQEQHFQSASTDVASTVDLRSAPGRPAYPPGRRHSREHLPRNCEG